MDLTEGKKELEEKYKRLALSLDIEGERERLRVLESELGEADTWKDRTRGEVKAKEAGEKQKLIEYVEEINRLIEGVATEDDYYEALRIFKRLELKTLFTSKYDKAAAIVTIQAGAGGADAEDWARMLFEMYKRYADKRGWKWEILDEGLGDYTFEVKGSYAYGYLKGEAGVHRLVRISPFSAKQLRHTSFALVEVLPEMADIEEEELKIPEDDLRVDLFRSSGPGGQNVNKVETAVRVTHLPTGISAASQVERSQSANKERAMNLLVSKLAHLMRERQVEELAGLKVKVKPEWGSQIRSYVLHPYKMVKDHRTEVETSQADKVLEGELDEFIEAEICYNE